MILKTIKMIKNTTLFAAPANSSTCQSYRSSITCTIRLVNPTHLVGVHEIYFRFVFYRRDTTDDVYSQVPGWHTLDRQGLFLTVKQVEDGSTLSTIKETGNRDGWEWLAIPVVCDSRV
jgi:hypothetical protein